MPGFINATRNITLQQIEDIANSSSIPEFMIRINNYVYDGWLYFILLATLGIILFVSANKVKDQPLNNAMYSSAAISVLSLLLRGINMSINGFVQGLLTDHQLWIFPIITSILALIVWAIKD